MPPALAIGRAFGNGAVRVNCALLTFMPPSSKLNLRMRLPCVMGKFLIFTAPKVSHLPVLGKVTLLASSLSSIHMENFPPVPALPLAYRKEQSYKPSCWIFTVYSVHSPASIQVKMAPSWASLLTSAASMVLKFPRLFGLKSM